MEDNLVDLDLKTLAVSASIFLIIILLIGLFTFKKESPDDGFYAEFQPTSQKNQEKKSNFRRDDKSYIYDPDEPRLG